MQFGLSEILPAIAFLVYTISGFYFLHQWIATGRRFRFLLYFAYGMGTFMWFKVPGALANLHISFAQYTFYLFFFTTFIAYFLAHFALVVGLASFRGFSHKKFSLLVLFSGTTACAFYYGLTFLGNDIITAPVWAGNFFFFIPMQLVLLFRFWRLSQWASTRSYISVFGVVTGALASFVLVLTSFLYVYLQVQAIDPDLWLASVISSVWISILQIVSGLLLFLSLRTLSKRYIANAP